MAIQVVFIDGIGGKRYMRGSIVNFFKEHGFDITCFDYAASSESFDVVKARLGVLLESVSAQGKYFVIGYSFGGILARAVLNESNFKFLPPMHLILLASPVKSSLLCRRFVNWKLFQMMTGEFGKVAASEMSMAAIELPNVPTSCVYGVWPWLGPLVLVNGFTKKHDGMLLEDEIAPQLFLNAIAIKASHAFIPSNALVLRFILDCFNVELGRKIAE
jgi:hypothetical protein